MQQRLKKAFAFVAIASLSSGGAAQSWRHFADCGDSNQIRSYSYDPASVRSQGSVRSVMIKGDYSRVAGTRTPAANIEWAVDCGSRTFVERSRVDYRADGSVARTYANPTGEMRIAANSVADKLMRKVCTRA